MSDTRTETSPDGRFEVTYWAFERAPWQWVEAPEVRDLGTGETLFVFGDDNLDGAVIWGAAPGAFTIALRRWPDGQHLTVRIDAAAGTVRLGDDGEAQPIAAAAELVTRHFEAHRPPAPPPPAPPAPASPLRRALDILGWIGLAAVLIAGLALAFVEG